LRNRKIATPLNISTPAIDGTPMERIRAKIVAVSYRSPYVQCVH
jgi:hypothetical protein